MHRLFSVVAVLLFLLAAVSATAQDTTPPVITSLQVTPAMVSPGDMVHVTVNAGDDVAVTGVAAGIYVLDNTSAAVWEGDVPADPVFGVHNINVVAVDAANNSTSDSTGSYRTVPVVGIRCDCTLDPVVLPMTADYLFMIWGKATWLSDQTFSVSDGGSKATWVTSPGHSICSGDYVTVKGILSSTGVSPAMLNANSYRILQPTPRTEMNISSVIVGKDLQVGLNGYIPASAPYGTLFLVNITSTDPSKVLLAKSQTAPGSSSITLTVPAGSSNIPTFYVQGLDSSGMVDVVATAPNCLGKTFHVTLVPSGFMISSPNSINTTSFSPNTNVFVRPVRLNPDSLSYSTYQDLRGGISANVDLTCSDPAVGALTENTLTFNGGDGSKSVGFDPVGAGTATISVVTPQSFSTPINYQFIIAEVTAPDIICSDTTVGLDLQTNVTTYLESAPPEAVDMVITVADPTVATITTDPEVEGSGSVTFAGVTNASSKTFYVQGRSIGSTTIEIEAPGYNSTTKTITVDPSGFVISSPGSISTTAFSANTNVYVRPARLRPDNLGYSSYQNLRAGIGSVEVSITSSAASVGVMTPGLLVFSGNSGSMTTSFDPVGSGTSVISISTPQGFSTPSTNQSINALVAGSSITANDVTVGLDLQTSSITYLQANPPQAVNITVEVGDPEIALVTSNANSVGAGTLVFAGVTSTASKTFYVQGLKLGTTTLTVSADGYATAYKTIKVDPSGFIISSPGSINTTTFASNTTVYAKSARLDPDTLAYSTYQNLRSGINDVEVSLGCSDPAVGAITASPLVFSGNIGSLTTSFDPVGAGTATISIGVPEGFSTPSTNTSITADVRMPNITANNETVGRDLQKSSSVYLESAPPTAVDIIVTVGDPNKATLSTSATAEGTGSITFTGVTNTNSKSFYVQGRGIGTTTLTVTAQGYNPVERTITIDPSGFVISSPTSITTRVTSSNSNVQIAAARLNPTDFRWTANQSLRGGLTVEVPVLSSNPNTGAITINPVIFNGNNTTLNTAFDPLAVGTSVISVGVPTGFSTPTTKTQITATVNP